MVQTVYLDILFLINFSMDFLCFYLSARIMSAKLSVPRSVAAAVLGGIYSDVALFLPSGYLLSLLFDLLVCFIMCAIVFGKRQGLLFSTVVYFAVSMALGGFMTALFNLLNRLGFSSLRSEENTGDGISVWLFAFLALLSGLFTLLGGNFFKKSAKVKRAELYITDGDRQKSFSALVDSGNLLREPISGRACIVLDSDAARGIIPTEIINAAKSGVSLACELDGALAGKIRLVPTYTATGEGILVGVRADKIEIDAGKGKRETDAMLVLSSIGKTGGADALVPLELLN